MSFYPNWEIQIVPESQDIIVFQKTFPVAYLIIHGCYGP
jgi:hypothetical protein